MAAFPSPVRGDISIAQGGEPWVRAQVVFKPRRGGIIYVAPTGLW